MTTNLEDIITQMNKQRAEYEAKGISSYLKLVEAKASYDDIAKAMWFTDSYSRIHYVMKAYRPNDASFFKFLGEQWTSFDNLFEFRYELVNLFVRNRQYTSLMMDDDDLEFYDSLPDVIKVYRGQDASNEVGLSWSTSKEVAHNFATMFARYRCKNPVLLSASIEKSQIFAVKVGRNESEVICLPNTLRHDILG